MGKNNVKDDKSNQTIFLKDGTLSICIDGCLEIWIEQNILKLRIGRNGKQVKSYCKPPRRGSGNQDTRNLKAEMKDEIKTGAMSEDLCKGQQDPFNAF